MKPTLESRIRAFSLVEIALALGLVSVGVLSLVGLLSTSLNVSRDAKSDGVVASMATQVLAELRSRPFEKLAFADLAGTPNETQLPNTFEDTIFYFDINGDLTTPSAANTADEAIYECRVKKSPQAEMQGVSGGVHNLVQVQLHFSWPILSNANPSQRDQQSRIYATIARYE